MRTWVMCLVVVAACQPMYGPHPDALRTPPPKPSPAGSEPVVTYIDDCTVDFHRQPTTVRRDTRAAGELRRDADVQLAHVEQTPDASSKIDLIKTTIAKYASALTKDPYDADATLGLALAYDRALRKGCALALLHRLGALADSPRFASAAGATIGRIGDNAAWFKAYRRDALAALGH